MISAVIGFQFDCSERLFSVFRSDFWCLDSVINGIPDQVDEWIADFIDDRAIELRLCSFDFQFDLLVKVLGELAYHSGEPVEYGLHRNHPHVQDDGLQIAGNPRHPFNRFIQFRIIELFGDFLKPSTVDDQFLE